METAPLEFGYMANSASVIDYAGIKKAGMSAVGVTAWEKEPSKRDSLVRGIRDGLRKHALEADSVHAGWDLLDAWRPGEMELLLQRDLEFAAAVGSRILVVHYSIFVDPERLIRDPDGTPRATLTVDRDLLTWSPMLDRIRRLLASYVAAAARLGVAIAVETDGNNSHRLLEFIGDTDPRYCGICFDTGHAQIDGDAVRLARLLGSRVICTHIHDNKCPVSHRTPRTMPQLREAFDRYCREDTHLLPFEGVVDWPELMRTLGQAGYRGRFTYETGKLELLAPINTRLAALWAKMAGKKSAQEVCEKPLRRPAHCVDKRS